MINDRSLTQYEERAYIPDPSILFTAKMNNRGRQLITVTFCDKIYTGVLWRDPDKDIRIMIDGYRGQTKIKGLREFLIGNDPGTYNKLVRETVVRLQKVV